MTKDIAILRVDPEGIGPQSHLVSIFDPTSVGQALFDTGWSNTEAVELLATIARDTVNNTARERMAAVKMIEDKSEKALTLAGIIKRVSLEATTQEDGVSKKLTADGLQLIRAGAARTMSTLELLDAGRQTPELINVDPMEDTYDPRTNGQISARKHPGINGSVSGTDDDTGNASGIGGSRRSEPGTRTERIVHGTERTSETGPEGTGTNDNQTTAGGAEDERISRTTIQSGRGIPSGSIREEDSQHEYEHGQDSSTPVPTLERPGYATPNTPGGIFSPSKPVNPKGRTTPYTPGEARRAADRVRLLESTSTGDPDGPVLTTPRPGDGATDTRKRAPNIAARFLPASLAANGFPGDDNGE